jgi:hypothetical protein
MWGGSIALNAVLLMRDVYPGSRFFSIPDPRFNNNKNLFSHLFFRHNFHKIANYLVSEQMQNKFFELIGKELCIFIPNNCY